MTLPLIFLTGLTAGGLSCLAIQGGLVLTTKKPFYFVAAKIITHTLLGVLLGFIGSFLTLSPVLRGAIQILTGIYLLAMAGLLLDLHPIFRYLVVKPPKFIAKYIHKNKAEGIGSAVLLGALTVFMPCANTQAMEVLAIGSGRPLWGGLIMFSFILGTSPLFLLLGVLMTKMTEAIKLIFNKVAGVILIVLAVVTINGGLGLVGSIYTLQNFYQAALAKESVQGVTTIVEGKQRVTINVLNDGYSPSEITLQNNIPVVVKLITNQVSSCSRSFTIPSLAISRILPESGETEIEFTPTKTGALVFSCSMGMYTGKFNVI